MLKVQYLSPKYRKWKYKEILKVSGLSKLKCVTFHHL